MLEDPYGAHRAEPALVYSAFRRKVREVIVVMIVAVVAGLALGAIFARQALADAPLYRAIGGNAAGEAVAEVVLHDEPCTLDAVANLPGRATWTEQGKVYEGCWGADAHLLIVQVYWSDRTVVAIPVRALAPLTRI